MIRLETIFANVKNLKTAPHIKLHIYEKIECRVSMLCKVDHFEPSEEAAERKKKRLKKATRLSPISNSILP